MQTTSITLAALLLCVAACRTDRPRSAVLGEAYAGPATLTLREAISLKSPPVATVKHGDKLDIIGTRRRFVKVRTAGGAEGWTHERSLLTREEMESLRELREQAEQWPSHGEATTFGPLNVHTEPYRSSPSFTQIQEGEKVEMLRHKLVLRGEPPPRKSLLSPAKPAPAKPLGRLRPEEPEIPPPPPPRPPPPPEGWADVSRRAAPAEAPEMRKGRKPPGPPPPPPRDEWTLIRTRSGQCGWVLRNRLVLTLPDEILQHAEGKRITSFFQIGETRDREHVRPVWLWTTVDRRLSDYDFDSARVFVWNQRRQRYETGFIDRNWKGLFPVVVGPVSGPRGSGPAPGFTLRIERGDGRIYRRSYGLVGDRVRFFGEQPES